MNQTKKRLNIINLAISITDIETIQLQILKLRLLHTDEKIQEILETLQNENYAQAQTLITAYIETPNKEILQRTFQKEKEKKKRKKNINKTLKEQAIINEFDLFAISEDEETENDIQTLDLDDMLRLEALSEGTFSVKKKNTDEIKTLDLNDMLKLGEEAEEEIQNVVQKTVNFDSLLNIKSEEILPDNIDLNIHHTSENDFWDDPASITMESVEIPKDTFFDETETVGEEEKSIKDIRTLENNNSIKEEDSIHSEKQLANSIAQEQENTTVEKEKEKEEVEVEVEVEKPVSTIQKYKAIPYIDQKLKNMQVQYPQIKESDEHFESVDNWLLKISKEGYSDADIEKIITRIDKLRETQPNEAAQLLLISAATESKYAQFRLARTLYKGDILQKNAAEAFTLINRLAVNDDYPEAICDLAQFYEYGVGIDKDKKKAEALYQEAMEAGIKRAAGHYVRLHKQNKGLFSFLSK